MALGDSYSSAEGDPYVDPAELKAEYNADSLDELGYIRDVAEDDLGWLGDTGNGGDKCHRSAHAYAARVWGELDQRDPSWGVTFRACSGATATALWDSFKGEGAQFDAFENGPADLITLGFGGNDIHFADIVKDCVEKGIVNRYVGNDGSPCQDKWDERVANDLVGLRAALRAAYGQVTDPAFLNEPARLKTGGKVIAIGYPRPFPADPSGTCSLGTAASIGEGSMRWVNERVVDPLNLVIKEEAKHAGIAFIDTSAYFSQFGERHDFCVDNGAKRWINRIIPSDVQRSVHPKYQYHEKVAEAVLRCWDRNECV